MNAVHATIHGHVQGVGFRYFVLRQALEHGVRGEVRNAFDGSVEVIAEGDPERIAAFLEDLREGPANARVEHVDLREHKKRSRYSSFTITG